MYFWQEAIRTTGITPVTPTSTAGRLMSGLKWLQWPPSEIDCHVISGRMEEAFWP